MCWCTYKCYFLAQKDQDCRKAYALYQKQVRLKELAGSNTSGRCQRLDSCTVDMSVRKCKFWGNLKQSSVDFHAHYNNSQLRANFG